MEREFRGSSHCPGLRCQAEEAVPRGQVHLGQGEITDVRAGEAQAWIWCPAPACPGCVNLQASFMLNENNSAFLCIVVRI